MKRITKTAFLLFLLNAGICQGNEFNSISSNTLELGSNHYQISGAEREEGLLETTKISLGTIYKSHHFRDNDYNETHNGIYLAIEDWSVGTYQNSSDVRSVFLTYNPNLYRGHSVEVDLVTGIADGYDDWDYAQNGILPIVGVSAKWMNLKAMLSPNVVAFGVELPMN